MKNLQIKHLKKFQPYTCARDLYNEGILLDANESYEQWLQVDWSKIKDLNRYPHSQCIKLRQKLAKKYLPGIKKEQILIGNGSDEIISLLIRAFVDNTENIMVMSPSYSVYETQAKLQNKKIKKITLNKDFTLPTAEIKKNIKNVKIIFICSPNNPTGNVVKQKELEEILNTFDGLIIIDEAYIEFAGIEKSYLNFINKSKNIAILRTFSKAWGLAGIRLGYIIANEEIIKILKKIKDPYNVSALAQEIGCQVLDQINLMKENVKKIRKNKIKLEKKLTQRGVKIIPTEANFILAQIKNASSIYHDLAKEGIITRDRTNPPVLLDTIRISVGSEEENDELVKRLKKILLKNIDINKLEGIMWDMDGVLVDVSQSYREAIKLTAERFLKRKVSKAEVNEIKNKIGMNNDWDATYSLIYANKKINRQSKEYSEIKDYFQNIYLGKKGLIDKETLLINKKELEKLKKLYKKMAIVTGRPRKEAEYILKKYKIENIFDVVICMEDTKNQKPDPEPLLKAMKKMEIDKTIYIGDSPSDIQAAFNANIPSVYLNEITIKNLLKYLYEKNS